MYTVYADGHLLHDDQKNIRLSGAVLTLELGKSGLFEFVIHQNHPYYTAVQPLKTMIEVQRYEKTIFRGRALEFEYGFHNEKKVICEGELAFLLDSIIEPHAYYGSFTEYLEYILNIHNAQVETEKQFAVGNVTVAEFWPFEVVEDFNFQNSFEVLNQRMVEPSGGFFQVRHEYGTMYIDLLSSAADVSNVSTQQIRVGKNLLDIKRNTKGSEVFSGIIPLGAKIGETENRLNISSVNGGSYSITNAEAVAAYGNIFRVVVFENITNAYTLLSEARTYLAENFAAVNEIEITAADLAGKNPSLDSFEVGQWVELVSDVHFTQPQTFLVHKMSIALSRPAETKIEVGRTRQGLTASLGYTAESISGFSSRISGLAENISGMSSKIEEAQTTANDVAERVTTLEGVQPYVIESGTTGIFSWKKFSDNTCEFFGKIPVSSYAITTSLGGWYRGVNLYEQYSYPYPFSMTEAPAVEMTFQTRNSSAAIAWIFSQDASTAQSYLPQCYLIRPVTGSNISGNINIIGKGKLA